MSKPTLNPQKAYALCAIAVLLWGSVSTVGKLYLQDVSILEFIFYMSGFASATLFVSILLQRKINLVFSFSKSDYLKLIPTGIIGILIYNMLYFKALTLTSAADVSIISYTWPLILVLLSGLLFKEKITSLNWASLFLGFTGVVLIMSGSSLLNINSKALTGDILVLTSSVIFALFFILSNKLKYDNYVFMFYSYLFSFITVGVYLLLTTKMMMPQENLLYSAMYVGALPSAIGFVFFSVALKIGNVSKIANLANITPFISLVFITLLLKQTPTWNQLIGLIVLATAIMLEEIVKQSKILNLELN